MRTILKIVDGWTQKVLAEKAREKNWDTPSRNKIGKQIADYLRLCEQIVEERCA